MRFVELPLAYACTNRSRFVAELKDFIRFPSVSAQPKQAKPNFRWVPDQNPREIHRLFQHDIADITPSTVRITIRTEVLAQPALVDRNHPTMQAAAVAYRQGFGQKPVFLRSGGTIPVVNLLHEILGIPTVLMGFALPDDQMHAPNERFYLPNFFNGITTSIHFLAEVASRLKSTQSHGKIALQA